MVSKVLATLRFLQFKDYCCCHVFLILSLHYSLIIGRMLVVDALEQSALVVLLAVLAGVEGLHHLGVLLGGEHLQGLCHLLAVSGVLDESSHLADHALDALL